MYITKVELQNFKRFTDLTIDGIPADTKLVLLIGSNGSGKSSVFDAFGILNRIAQREGFVVSRTQGFGYFQRGEFEPDGISGPYYRKDGNSNVYVNLVFSNDRRATYSSNIEDFAFDLPSSSFYGRSSFRYIAAFTNNGSEKRNTDFSRDADRPPLYVAPDRRFENDIELMVEKTLKDLYDGKISQGYIVDKYVNPINKALANIFNTKFFLSEIVPPEYGGFVQIIFSKGEQNIHYNYLSAGEKEVFNILFNLLVRRDQFTDTVYFFDEIDLHLNTKLQFNLLKEITENWIPGNCQFWTASHSLGFIDYARQYDKGVIIDFDDLDFDQPQTLFPQPKDRLDVYDIAVPKEMLFEIMKDKKIVLCENQNDEYYNLLALPNTLFVGMKDARSLFLQIKNDNRYYALRDRDFLSDTEIERLENQHPTYRILHYYDFENYLYHPDNIAELNRPDFDRDAYVAEIVYQKKTRFNALLLNLKSSRSYEELKTGDVMDKTPDSIVDDLQSDEFERFYKFFDMKDGFNKTYLTRFNLDKKQLVKTTWFRQQFETILNR